MKLFTFKFCISHLCFVRCTEIVPYELALFDTQIDSIQCSNFAQNWFNSIFDSKSFHENSIQKIIQFKINCWDSIQQHNQFKIISCDSIQEIIQFTIVFGVLQFNRLLNSEGLKAPFKAFSEPFYLMINHEFIMFHFSVCDKIQFKIWFIYQFSDKFHFKIWLICHFSDKIQFKNIFKILKLAVFNSIKYSFIKKTWVSNRATLIIYMLLIQALKPWSNVKSTNYCVLQVSRIAI